LNLQGRFGLFVSALKIPFPGNGNFSGFECVIIEQAKSNGGASVTWAIANARRAALAIAPEEYWVDPGKFGDYDAAGPLSRERGKGEKWIDAHE
jgi:hypothetical protein